MMLKSLHMQTIELQNDSLAIMAAAVFFSTWGYRWKGNVNDGSNVGISKMRQNDVKT